MTYETIGPEGLESYAREGTSLHTALGAAKYWERRAKAAESKNRRSGIGLFILGLSAGIAGAAMGWQLARFFGVG